MSAIPKHLRTGTRVIAVALLLAGGIIVIGVGVVGAHKWVAELDDCQTRLALLSEAMRDFHRDHGAMPPAWTVDRDGKPMHSWRTLLLPYLVKMNPKIAVDYDFRRRWNSDENKNARSQLPEVFACPCESVGRHNGWTSYVGVVSRDPAGHPHLIAIVEVPESNIGWTEPIDCEWDDFDRLVHAHASGQHNGMRHVLLEGGVVKSVAQSNLGRTVLGKDDTAHLLFSPQVRSRGGYGIVQP